MIHRGLVAVVVLAALSQISACCSNDDGAYVTYAGTEALTPTQGISAWEYLIVASPAPSCSSAIAAFQAGETPPGTVYRNYQAIEPYYGRNDFRLTSAPEESWEGCRAGSAMGTFVSLLYDAAEPPCVNTGCAPDPGFFATACEEGVTIYADRATTLVLTVQPVP